MIKLSYYINSSLKEVSDGLAGVTKLQSMKQIQPTTCVFLLLLFVNKELSEHSHTNLFAYCATLIDLSSYNRDHMSCKAESIYNQRLYRKSLPTYVLGRLKNDFRN